MRRLLTIAAASVIGLLCFVGVASAGDASNVGIHPGAHTSFDRTYNWVVTKTDDQHSSVTIAQNQALNVTYTITVSNGTPAYTDSNWVVEDGIPMNSSSSFTLDAPSDVTAVASQDGGTVNTAGQIDYCSTDSLYNPIFTAWPFNGPNFLCHYVIALPDGTPGTMTATVTFGDGSLGTGTAPFNFIDGGGNLIPGQPTIKQGTVNVVDSVAGALGSVSAGHPQTFTYSVPVPSSTCGSFDMPNTVNLIDSTTGNSVASASDTVHVTVTCPHVSGCTLTQGYWKTHSIYGPAAKPDPTWNLLPGGLGPNTPFFSSGQTWIQVFNTSPAGGNAYYVLAHQYEAAVLNQLSGASSTSAVDSALADAKTFFNTYTPATAGALRNSSAVRNAALNDAATLDNYNSGLIGPGSCD